jgi:hypothetical protein
MYGHAGQWAPMISGKEGWARFGPGFYFLIPGIICAHPRREFQKSTYTEREVLLSRILVMYRRGC